VNYVDAGYVSALAVLFVYAVALTLRRRRLERAQKVTEADDRRSGSTRGEQL
jgi:hypothetical protein